ncbi:hypothetical protein LXL04_000097 [Taraxacum kok-saghyz]
MHASNELNISCKTHAISQIIRKYHVGYCSTRGTVHRLVIGSGHGLAEETGRRCRDTREMPNRHFIEHLVCTGTVAVAICVWPSKAEECCREVWSLAEDYRDGIWSNTWCAPGVAEQIGRDLVLSEQRREMPMVSEECPGRCRAAVSQLQTSELKAIALTGRQPRLTIRTSSAHPPLTLLSPFRSPLIVSSDFCCSRTKPSSLLLTNETQLEAAIYEIGPQPITGASPVDGASPLATASPLAGASTLAAAALVFYIQIILPESFNSAPQGYTVQNCQTYLSTVDPIILSKWYQSLRLEEVISRIMLCGCS